MGETDQTEGTKPLVVPSHTPEEIGEYSLVERSDEQAVWRTTWDAIAGKYKSEMKVFPQYGGWRVKYHYNINMAKDRPGGYRYIDNTGSRATYDERERAEQRAVNVLETKAETGNWPWQIRGGSV